MHDPMTVAGEIRRPWPKVRKTKQGEKVAGWRPRWQINIGFGRQTYFSPFVYWLGRELYFPALVTIWHVDPEAGGHDDSCRRAWARATKAGSWPKRKLLKALGPPYLRHAVVMRWVNVTVRICEDGKLVSLRVGS